MQAFETRYLYSKIFAAFFTSLEAWSSVRALTASPEQLRERLTDTETAAKILLGEEAP